MTELVKTDCYYYALTIDNFIQMDIDTGQLEIYEEYIDAIKNRRGRQTITEVSVRKKLNRKQR